MMCLRLVSALLLVVSAHGVCDDLASEVRCFTDDEVCTTLKADQTDPTDPTACKALCEANGRAGCCQFNGQKCEMCFQYVDFDNDGVPKTIFGGLCTDDGSVVQLPVVYCDVYECTTGVKKSDAKNILGGDDDACCDGTVEQLPVVYCKDYKCTAGHLPKSNAATIMGGDDVTCCDEDWVTTFAACSIGVDQEAKCPNDPAKCVSGLTSDELISVCAEFKKKGTPCETDPLALKYLNDPCKDKGDLTAGSTTISASILAFVGSFVILLA